MLRRLLVIVCCLLTIHGFSEEESEQIILSTPEQVGTFASEPSYLIGGLISPLSGQPVLRQTDLLVKGAQSLSFNRLYIPPYMPSSFPEHKHNRKDWRIRHLQEHLQANYQGWRYLPHLKLKFDTIHGEVHLTDPNGTTLAFRVPSLKRNRPETTLTSLPYAISNAVGDLPSGKYDPRNTKITCDRQSLLITVYVPDGTKRLYRGLSPSNGTSNYYLEKEILPNGKVLRYTCKGSFCHKIESLDPHERYVYASIHRPQLNPHFFSSSGITLDYTHQSRPYRWRVKVKDEHEKREGTFPSVLTGVSSPFYRYESLGYNDFHLLDFYSGKNDVFRCEYAGFGKETPHFRVQKLLWPVGQNDSFYPVFEMSYAPPVPGKKEGTTTVKSSDGTSIIYQFSKDLLVTAIQYYGQDGKLKKEKLYAWNEKNWLKSVEMRDAQKNLFNKRSYNFDSFGNPILEVFCGDLTGEETHEEYATVREFSQDGRNLLLKEAGEDGKVICYTYLPYTNLITSKLTKDGDKILLREFSKYDECHNLIQKIADDGESGDETNLSGVTQRTLTNYLLRQEAPFLHMPEWIEEKYWEEGREKSLKKTHLIYDQLGNVAQEEVYDADGVLAYTIYKQYNERGDLLSETNRLGQQATYAYDHKGRSASAINFSQRLHTTFSRDTKGRLRGKTEKGDDETTHSFSYLYDAHDRVIQKSEPFADTTRYTYDPLVNQVIRTDSPSIVTHDGSTSVTALATYDAFGREVAKTDANGNVTTYRYNAYGSVAEITYPDGSREHFRYSKNGKLVEQIDQEGLTIRYRNDVLGRPLSKTYLSADGQTLAEEFFTYSGFDLLTKTDKEGNLTRFFYDGVGRKIREEFCSKVVDYRYDSLGQLATICKYNGDNTLLMHYKRDAEGRVIEESTTDASGQLLTKIVYAYDEEGNQSSITRYINGKEATTSFVFDAFNRQVQEQDALGHVTQTIYQEGYTNQLGQNVLQIATTDPRHITTLETRDAYGRAVKQEVLNSQNATIACQEMLYDLNGNLSLKKDQVYENTLYKNTQLTKYSYTNRNQTASVTRGFNTKSSRTTSYAYTPAGKRESKVLPNGIRLTYAYHPLGFLQHLNSSDGTIQFIFQRNRLGQLLLATDEVQKSSIQRELDPHGNIVKETFPSGLTLEKTYDAFDRPLTLNLPDQSGVLFTYNPQFLKSAVRTSSSGDALYTHSYDYYDHDGNLVAESLIGDLGQVRHSTDLKGQKLAISSNYFSQQNTFDPCGNLLSSQIDANNQTYAYDGLSQLTTENGASYAYDSLYNRTKRNTHNELNELLAFGEVNYAYDLNGNQIVRRSPTETVNFTYDPLNRLIKAKNDEVTVEFTYDPLDRRLSKTVHTPSFWSKRKTQEHYLYDGAQELGAFTDTRSPINLRILSPTHKALPSTIAVEIGGHTFAPILDCQGSIRRLIDLYYKSCTHTYNFTAFGEDTNPQTETYFNPWRYASKRFDHELNLIYFGKRYYDPSNARWLTTDPAGPLDSTNLYQYLLNNPFHYTDPDGQFILEISLLALSWKVLATAVATLYVGYQVNHYLDTHSQNAANQAIHEMVQNLCGVVPKAFVQAKKNAKVYAPDRPLPMTEDGVPIPDTDDSHTQLGTKDSKRRPGEKYPQAREFDKNGKPVKTIDFTDHGEPHIHPNPHEHLYEPNPTGGTPQRGDPKPLENWNY